MALYPLLLDRDQGVLLGHLARGNPQWESFGEIEALAIFSGPHAYVSPSWYATAPAVPTWNYAVIHVSGVPRLLTPDRTREVVDLTVRKFEAGRRAPWSGDLPDEFLRRMLAGIVGFEMPVARVEGKFKLGQNRSAADQAGMLAGLRGDGAEAALLAEFIGQHQASVPHAESNAAPDTGRE
jgi:transcriptional regulator